MSEKEKKAIELLKQPPDLPFIYVERENAIRIVLKLIKKQQKEIEDLKDTIKEKEEKRISKILALRKLKKEMYKEVDNYYISKDKIRTKIKELEEVKIKELENDDEFGIHSLGWGNADYIQDYLKDLLEENNND